MPGLALLEAKLLIGTVLQKVVLRVEPSCDVVVKLTVTLNMKNGLWVKVLPRETLGLSEADLSLDM